MQAVRAVVDGQLVGLAVEGELAVLDAVGYAATDGVKIGLLGSPLLRCAEAKDDILDFPFAVGNQQFGDLRAEIRDLRFETTAALDGIELDGFHKPVFRYFGISIFRYFGISKITLISLRRHRFLQHRNRL